MTNPFAPNQPGLIAPRAIFDEHWTPPRGAKQLTVNHSMRAALAMEIAHQLSNRVPGLVIKGGTPLQARLGWPPARASIDIDLEYPSASTIVEASRDLLKQLEPSSVTLDGPTHSPHATTMEFHFPLTDAATDMSVRIDIASPGSSSTLSTTWTTPPSHWAKARQLRVPPLEVQAAQKLLLAAPHPFGRFVEDQNANGASRSKQNLCKDLFDLACLGRLALDSVAIGRAVQIEVASKSEIQGTAFEREVILLGAQRGWARFAGARVDASADLKHYWSAFSDVHKGISAPYTEAEARMAAGCAYHAIGAIAARRLDWQDSWTPFVTGRSRSTAATPIRFVVPAVDGFAAARGLAEAWAA